MSKQSTTSRIIDTIVASVGKSFLRPRGYRKIARSFHKLNEPLYKVIEFQASWLNTPTEAKFTINLNIVLPYFHEKWCGTPMPRNPGSAAPVLSLRIGRLRSQNFDDWWTVTPQSNVQEVSDDVATQLNEYALPFLDQFESMERLIDIIATESLPPSAVTDPGLVTAILLAYLGRDEESRAQLKDVRSSKAGRLLHGFRETIDLIEERLVL